MAYNANENLWTPGRRHAGTELETEFDAGVTALSNGTIIAADFSPRAALAPWNFQNALTLGCPVFRRWGLSLAAGGINQRLGGEFQARRIRYRFTELQGFIAVVSASNIRFQLFSVDNAGAETLLGTVTVVAGNLDATFGVVPVVVPRERRLRAYVAATAGVGGPFTMRQAFLVVKLRRFWVT